MPKTAAQLVPLKTQLSSSLYMARFADTSDVASAYYDQTWDNSGGGVGKPVLPSPLAALPTTQGPPTALTMTVDNAATTGTLNRYSANGQIYYLAFYDSSVRLSQPMKVVVQPGPGTTNSVTFNWTIPVSATGIQIWKVGSGGGGSYSYTRGDFTAASGTRTHTDASGKDQTITSGSVASPPNWATDSTAPAMGPEFMTVTVNSTGGAHPQAGYAYAVSAYSTLGETLPSAQEVAVPVGTPLITTMGTVTPSTLGTGGLPAGTYYYRVTAYSNSPTDLYGHTAASPSNISAAIGRGVGHTECLPSPEVTVTLNAAGSAVLNWTAVPNAQGYVIYRSRDLLAPVITSVTTATTGGTLAAGTYYYRVTALTRGSAGETVASNELSVTTTTATATATVTWGAVPQAYGYRIYRSTTAGGAASLVGTVTSGTTTTFTQTSETGVVAQEPPTTSTAQGTGQATYLATIVGGSTATYTDAGATSPANTGFTPPKVNAATYGPARIRASWTAPATAPVGYNVYRLLPTTSTGVTLTQNTLYPARQITGATLADDDNTATLINRRYPRAATAATDVVRSAGRYFTYATAVTLTSYGVTFTGVAGKRYRIAVIANSTASTMNQSNFITATGAPQYAEVSGISQALTAATQYAVVVMGEDATCTLSWPAQPVPTGDLGQPTLSDDGTYVAGIAYPWLSTGDQNSYMLLSPNQTAVSLPVRHTVRRTVTPLSALGSRGSLLGLVRQNQVALSANTVYGTPVKAILPNWNLDVPALASGASASYVAGRYVTVEVSTDNGSTWTALTNQQRHAFPVAATQMLFRYTMPPNIVTATFDRRAVPSFPAVGTGLTSGGTYTLDQGTSARMNSITSSGSPADIRLTTANGGGLVMTSSSAWFYNTLAWPLGTDQEVVVNGVTTGVNQTFGARLRTTFAGTYEGFYAWGNTDGTVGLTRFTTAGSSPTTVLGTRTNAFPAGTPATIRAVAIGTRFVVFCNGRQVLDITDATAGTFQTNAYVGVSGENGSVIESAQSINLTAATPPWELDFFGAYLET